MESVALLSDPPAKCSISRSIRPLIRLVCPDLIRYTRVRCDFRAKNPGSTGRRKVMPSWLSKLQPTPWLLRKLIMLAILAGVGVGAFFYGKWQQATAARKSAIGIDT